MTQISARRLAYDILQEVETRDAYANLLLSKRLASAGLEAADAGFVTELVAGTLRLRGRYDAILERASGRTISEIDAPLRNVLRLGVHQLVELGTAPHAAINEQVELAKQVAGRKTAGFVNGVLRTVSRTSAPEWFSALTVAEYTSHPDWIIKAMSEALQLDGLTPQTELNALLQADNEPPKVQLAMLNSHEKPEGTKLLWTGISPVGAVLETGNPSHVMKKLRAQGIQARVQDQGSQVAALALARFAPIREGEQWLDLCAGPGGKTALLASEAAQGNVYLRANEVSEHRARLVRRSVQELSQSVDVVIHDGRSDAAYGGKMFDRILVDAPCTGLGALRRRPEARWRKRASDLADLTTLQKELLESATRHLKPGGVLAYVTCSPHPDETTRLVDAHLREHPELSAANTRDIINSFTRHPIGWGKRNDGYAQLWPHRDGTDAMFIALLRRTQDEIR